MGLQTIPLDQIDDRDRLRPVDAGQVRFLAENIQQTGQLLQPISLRYLRDGAYKLMAGGHRLAAVRQLGWTEIAAFVFEANGDEARLAEIDENLVRHELNPLDRAVFLAERKALYEKLHPETRHGAQGGRGAKRNEDDTLSFSKDTAARVGLDERTIQRAVMIASRLAPDVRGRIAGSAIARTQTELLALARLPPSEQRAIVEAMLADSPRARNVAAARRLVTGAQPEELDPDSGKFAKLVALWGRSGPVARRDFLTHLAASGDLTRFGPIKRGGKTSQDEAA
ncbi:ParB N-terminal domain-containing protein [Niveispirillum sp. BGYR6]|uniref:ParB/RepB/Spo0J family partition protein n=1 Tax=Niveispirillum sp. BGYR6 TaxID=2971249 RepID=UPI0022B99537|nr:ParB N-terminal domain-containing protein [Niveispirillum sp. BGYR6]MDG5497409.1 ParB N-terminal domain-containing protein [Niveispirillum sp. BGYR6]